MSDTKPNTHIIALDAFRGLAAVCVVAHHIGQISGMSIGRHGYIAVDFFFMLSGFVVSQAYERTFGGGVRAASFLWARVQRLYPTIFVGLIFGSAALYVAPWREYTLGPWVIIQFLLIPLWYGRNTFPVNGPIWSIFFELFINAAHAAFYRYLNFRGIAIITFITGGMFASIISLSPELGAHRGWAPGTNFAIGFIRVAFSYFVGVVIFRLSKAGRLPQRSIPFSVLAVALLFLIVGPAVGPRPLPDIIALYAGFPLILIFGLNTKMDDRVVPIGRWLAAISFPLYATHMPILRLASAWTPTPIAWIAVGGAVLAIATIVEYCIDKPVRDYLKSKRARPDVLAGAASI